MANSHVHLTTSRCWAISMFVPCDWSHWWISLHTLYIPKWKLFHNAQHVYITSEQKRIYFLQKLYISISKYTQGLFSHRYVVIELGIHTQGFMVVVKILSIASWSLWQVLIAITYRWEIHPTRSYFLQPWLLHWNKPCIPLLPSAHCKSLSLLCCWNECVIYYKSYLTCD